MPRARSRGTSACCTTSRTTCSSSRGARRRTPARRTSTRSTRCPTRAGSRTASARASCRSEQIGAGPMTGRPPAPEKWVIIREKAAGYAPGFTARTPTARRGSCRSIRPANPEGATAAVVVANRLFWALGYNQVETFITDVRPGERRRSTRGDRAAARRARGRRSRATTSKLCSSGPPETPTARIAWRRAGCCRERSSAGSATRARGPTIPTTSCRTSIAASCGRCASSAPGRT